MWHPKAQSLARLGYCEPHFHKAAYAICSAAESNQECAPAPTSRSPAPLSSLCCSPAALPRTNSSSLTGFHPLCYPVFAFSGLRKSRDAKKNLLIYSSPLERLFFFFKRGASTMLGGASRGGFAGPEFAEASRQDCGFAKWLRRASRTLVPQTTLTFAPSSCSSELNLREKDR